jgi:hypothetical protein
VKELIDEIITEEFASPDLELHWLDEDEKDSETVLEARVKLGAITLNEMRNSLGLDPFDNAAADRPMVLTATGYVPIEMGASSTSSPAGLTRGSIRPDGSCPTFQKYSPDQPRVAAGNSDGGQWTTESSREILEGDLADQIADDKNRPETHPVRVAQNLRCDGFYGGCASGGTYGTNAMYHIGGRNLCRECAVKVLGIPNDPSGEQTRVLSPFQIQGK